jgi:hypothetical protein
MAANLAKNQDIGKEPALPQSLNMCAIIVLIRRRKADKSNST